MIRKFKVTYSVRNVPEGIEPAALSADEGAADQLIVITIMDGDDGGKSYAMLTTNGEEFLSPSEVFKAWTMLATQLADTLPPGGRRFLCESVVDAIREAAGIVERPPGVRN